MPKRRAVVTIGTLGLDRASTVPLHRQLYDELREAILTGRVRPGTRLPSTRTLAADISASRNTVLTAFGQLLAEGYLEGRVGAGTTVASTLPETLLRAHPQAARAERPGRRPRLSRRGALLVSTRAALARGASAARPFRPGLPGLEFFPSISGLASSPVAGDGSRASSSTTAIQPATRRSGRRSPRISARRGPCAARRSR